MYSRTKLEQKDGMIGIAGLNLDKRSEETYHLVSRVVRYTQNQIWSVGWADRYHRTKISH
jgi:hypothetical protein